MKLKKLLIATTLAIPAMGYCGLMGWITGYPEVKEKIEQRLEQKYHGDKFEVSGVSYSSDLGGYNFTAKDIDRDITKSGSYFLEANRLVANGFMWEVVGSQWRDMFEPIVKKLSDNYLITGGIGTQSPVNYKQMKKNPVDTALENLFDNSPTALEWIKKDHDAINANISIFINMPKTPAGMLKILNMLEELNNYLRSLKLYSYKIAVTPMEVPKDLGIDNYITTKNKEDKHYRYSDFINDGDIQKYAWGWIELYSCQKIDAFEKFCNTYKDMKDPSKLDLKLIKHRTSADRIYNLADIAKDFHLFKNPGKETMWNQYKHKGKDVFMYTWNGGRMLYTALIETQLYKQVLQLQNQ